MAKQTKIVEGLLTSGGRILEERTEWVPSVVGRVRSTWRDPIGKKLTNARIAFYQREGRYGKEAQERALAACVDSNGFIHRCKCGTAINVRYVRWSYMPTPGYWCPNCIALHRSVRDKEKEQSRRMTEMIEKEYV